MCKNKCKNCKCDSEFDSTKLSNYFTFYDDDIRKKVCIEGKKQLNKTVRKFKINKLNNK